MPKSYPDMVVHTTQDSGTGDLTFGDTVASFRSIEAVSTISPPDISSGDEVAYVIEEAGAREKGRATVTSDFGSPATWTLNRSSATDVISTDGKTKINAAGGGATKIFLATAEDDLLRFYDRSDQDGTIAVTNAANTFTGNQQVDGDLTVRDTDAGVAEGPVVNILRDSASPADADVGGVIKWQFKNDAATPETWNAVEAEAIADDITDGTEDGQLVLSVMRGGVKTEVLRLSNAGAGFFGQALDGWDKLSLPTDGLRMGGVAPATGWGELITATAISGSPTAVDFSTGIDSTYETYVIVLDDVTASASTELLIRMGVGSADSGASDYAWETLTIGGTNSFDGVDSEIETSTNALTANGVSGFIYMFHPSDSGRETSIMGLLMSGDRSARWLSGTRTANQATDFLRFYIASGTFSGGRITLYGLKKS